jgi:hypothetical protein
MPLKPPRRVQITTFLRARVAVMSCVPPHVGHTEQRILAIWVAFGTRRASVRALHFGGVTK